MKTAHSSISVILFAFFANLIIFIIKLLVALVTGSSAMLAEAVHSLADTLNQVLLLVGIRRARRRPDATHPFGFSRELYFWSFIVAILLFTAGAAFSVYEGIHKILHPESIVSAHWALTVLLAAMAAEGIAFRRALTRIRKEKGKRSILGYLISCKRSEIMVVFLEDLAALCGLAVALVSILIQMVTGWVVLDGLASVIIGLILSMVAFFLAREIHSLIIGEAADPKLVKEVEALFDTPPVRSLIYIKSLQRGPEDILLGIKLEFDPRLTGPEISREINQYEERIRDAFPCVRDIFIEPDVKR